MKPPLHTNNKLTSKPSPTTNDWADRRSFQIVECARFILSAWLNVGADTAASRPPAQIAGTMCTNLSPREFTDLKVNKSDRTNGTARSSRLTSSDVSEVILVLPKRCWMSLPDSVLTARPPQSARKLTAALLFKK